MAKATPKSILYSSATLLPATLSKGHHRTGSRSPARKAQFAAKELDPLLSNLSPSSILKALQDTETIGRGAPGQDALTRSIADASTTERELGIRTAVAAKKLKEWKQEVSTWPWPEPRDRRWGAGFITPKHIKDKKSEGEHLGTLPKSRVSAYRERIEEIRDGIDALELEAIKDQIFSAHVPSPVPAARTTAVGDAHQQPLTKTSYGRMRDFTALITATVIQALPDLANLNFLLDTWDVRLSVLRQLPGALESLESTKAGIRTAATIVTDPQTGPLVTQAELDTTRSILGDKVAAAGARIDRLLDLLEDQEDSLPQAWIDSIEDIENKYASWVVTAESVVMKNTISGQPRSRADAVPEATPSRPPVVHVAPASTNVVPATDLKEATREISNITHPAESSVNTASDTATSPNLVVTNGESPARSFLRIDPLPSSGHRRGVSEVSMADSTYSIENAEIVHARSTPVLASPKISVVDNPFRSSRDELSWFGLPSSDHLSVPRPGMLQRASTASIEVIPKDKVKQVQLRRSLSHDMLAQLSPAAPSTPSTALRQLTGTESVRGSPTPVDLQESLPKLERNTVPLTAREPSPSPTITPPLPDEETRYPLGEVDTNVSEPYPEVPRRSSKRLSQVSVVGSVNDRPATPPLQTIYTDGETRSPIRPSLVPAPLTRHRLGESLDARIRDIITALPGKIRLTDDPGSGDTHESIALSSTQGSTPINSLTLSPVREERSHRQGGPSGVRVYHLSKSGHDRDGPPVKLFVRAVGEHGERVMVRVGGGWADLGEYLREYSLHHGGPKTGETKLEVASYPGNPSTSSQLATPPPHAEPSGWPKDRDAVQARRTSAPVVNSGPVSGLAAPKPKKNTRARSPDSAVAGDTGTSWVPPPVPPIPASYASQQSSSFSVPRVNSFNHTDLVNNANTGVNTITTKTPQFSTTTTVQTTTPSGMTYTPLGAAGPKRTARRVTSRDALNGPEHEAWVNGMVDKARAVGGNHTTTTTTIQGPSTTTTTTIARVGTGSGRSRRSSAFFGSSPVGSTTTSPAGSTTRNSTATAPSESHARLAATPSPTPHSPSAPGSAPVTRPRSRMSFGDVGGIRRVFLRRKSDK